MTDPKPISPAAVKRAGIALSEIASLVKSVQLLCREVIQNLPRENSNDADALVGAGGLISQIGLIAEIGLVDLGESTFYGASATEWLMPPVYRDASCDLEVSHG
jgi:hypothetical protein